MKRQEPLMEAAESSFRHIRLLLQGSPVGACGIK